MSAAAIAPARPELSVRSWALWGAVLTAGAVAIALSAHSLVASPLSSHAVYGALVLFVFAWMAHRQPVPLTDGGSLSLDIVFVVCAAVMYGAALATLIAATVCASVAHSRRRPHPVKLAFNTGVFALMGGAAGLAAHAQPSTGLGLIAAIALAATAAGVTNIGLVALMIARARYSDFAARALSIARLTALPYALSLSIVPLFVVSWRVHPYIALLAVVPLGTVALHLRSLEQSRQATALSLTDPLTGLGNRRHLNERLARELDRADVAGEPLSVCVLDVDGFKEVNDRGGHDAGDQALVAIAEVLRQGGEAFRLGGDEFVLLLPGHDAAQGAAVSAAVAERVRGLELAVSAGTATYLHADASRADLLRAADEQMYAIRATRR
jgi:diguanylate cyclase (GGDEF)-like protein